MRILYVTTSGSTMCFFSKLIEELVKNGNTVDIACNENIKPVIDFFRDLGCNIFNVPWSREPLSKCNFSAIKVIKKIAEDGNYDIVHCHTPVAAFCTRIACNSLRKKGLSVIYTAHGFHFFKGAPIKNWLMFFPLEWFCSFKTDVLVTITKEDYERTKKSLHPKKCEYVPGVGIDIDKFANATVDKEEKRKEIGVPPDAYLILSVGELNANKNHEAVIRKIAESDKKNVHYVIAGDGKLKEYLLNLSKELGISDRVHLLGIRSDVEQLYKIADLYCLPSKREGLNVSLMEAKTAGLECKCNSIRGNVDIMATDDISIFDVNKINEKMISIYEDANGK